jgi:hypothetical protein
MRLSVLVGAIAIIFCGSAEQEATQQAVASRQLMDEAVIETVLVDVLVSSDEEPRSIRRDSRISDELIFRNECYDNVFLNAGGIRSANKRWGAVKLADVEAARAAGENVLDRLNHKVLYAPFNPQDKRISIWRENLASTQSPYPKSARPFRVGPPGYADENRLAVVVLFFPGWNNRMNGGRTTYLLRLDGNKWNVIARDINFFV